MGMSAHIATTVISGALSAGVLTCAAFTSAAPAHAAAPAACQVASHITTTFPTPQGPRKAKIVVPAGANATTPMIVSMHGATGSAVSQEKTSGFTTIARRDNAIVVYPQAKGESPKTVWNAAPNSPDVDYVASLVTYMQASGCSNPTRTIVNGFSMGAMMTSRLMCSHGNLFSGAAMVGGVFPPTPGCTVDKTKPIIVVHGQTDPIVPFDGTIPSTMLQALAGGPAVSTFPGMSRSQMAAAWNRAKGCTAQRFGSVRLGYTEVDYSCKYSTTQALIHPGGHVWNPESGGVNTSEYIWAAERPAPMYSPSQEPRYGSPAAQKAAAIAIARRVARDPAFAVWRDRLSRARALTDPAYARWLGAAVAAEVKAHPYGKLAIRLREAARQ